MIPPDLEPGLWLIVVVLSVVLSLFLGVIAYFCYLRGFDRVTTVMFSFVIVMVIFMWVPLLTSTPYQKEITVCTHSGDRILDTTGMKYVVLYDSDMLFVSDGNNITITLVDGIFDNLTSEPTIYRIEKSSPLACKVNCTECC